MGRYRPPRPPSSPYITPEGFKTLQDELDDLWRRRADVVKALSAAAAEGDRSENAEYIYRKKELGGIDYRVRYLQKRLPALNIVRDIPDTDQVFFGAWVTVEREDGSRHDHRLVGADEADANQSTISIDSPMARALLKRRVDDEIELVVGDRRETCLIVGIRYSPRL